MKTIFILNHSYEFNTCEETKFIGAYSTLELAQSAINRLSIQPGFRDRVDAFYIDEYEIDKDNWTEGYTTMTVIKVKDKNNSWVNVQAEDLSNETYKIIELYENDNLGEFKHLDIVRCEEKDNELYAIELIERRT